MEMPFSPLVLGLISGALIIVAGLAFYAGKLLFLLKQQTAKRNALLQARIDNLTESIQTIAHAMQQQQCDVSEGSIRLCVLLDNLPLQGKPDFSQIYPALHGLYEQIKHFPTHDARKELSAKERRRQDKEREELEVQYESLILKEVELLRHFKASSHASS